MTLPYHCYFHRITGDILSTICLNGYHDYNLVDMGHCSYLISMIIGLLIGILTGPFQNTKLNTILVWWTVSPFQLYNFLFVVSSRYHWFRSVFNVHQVVLFDRCLIWNMSPHVHGKQNVIIFGNDLKWFCKNEIVLCAVRSCQHAIIVFLGHRMILYNNIISHPNTGYRESRHTYGLVTTTPPPL